jgi:hypothetical protein
MYSRFVPGFGGGLPDLSSLSDDDLTRLLAKLEVAAREQPNAQLRQGEIDIVRAELVARGHDAASDRES